uniref:NACHT domain-containing protein n=1 Tax=Electrophorus electricus TaxID=8005 RepID=A0AAY5EZ69_ELEEL
MQHRHVFCQDKNNTRVANQLCSSQCEIPVFARLFQTLLLPQLHYTGLCSAVARWAMDSVHSHLWSSWFPVAPCYINCYYFYTDTVFTGECQDSTRNIRVFLVDKLEWHIDSVVDLLITKDVFSRDDREDVLFEKGPRGKVRKVLDILDCKDYQKIIAKHKAALKRRSESMLYYNTRHGEKIPFSEHYVNLLIVKGHHSLEIKRHEVLTFGQQRISLQQKASEKFIKPAQLFSNETGMQPNKKILVTGVAGIGKTVLVQKILCDFSNDKEYTSFDFIIHLTFRDLNLIRRPISFRELILRKNGHLAKHLDTITENDVKLLIILDGFDEFKHYRACDADVFLTEIDEEGEVPEVLSSLILGELLPRASVLVTSRPMAVGYIPVGAIDCFVVITGFSTTEIHDFFQRFFQDQDVASRMFDTVAANELMLTLCYIPAFCHIVCRILKDSDCLSTASPRTMTDIYVQYLLALVKSHMKNRVETLNVNSRIQDQEHLQKILIKLGRLAYQKLMKQETLFYSNDDEIMNCAMVSTFLDKTSIQEPGCTEDIYSFTHLTIQEFFAALYSAMADVPLSETLGSSIESTTGNLDLFARFLSGLLSKRNQELLNRNIGFEMHEDKMQSFRIRLVSDTQTLCENGAYILTHLHCILEQQDVLLIQELQPQSLRINLSDVSLSLMDHNAVKYFLSEIQMTIFELDLTGTNTSAKALKDLEPYLLRCENLCAIWNNVTDDEAERLNSLYPGQCFVVSFTDDSMWEGWAQWVLQRCEVSSSEKLVTFLQKVCDISLCSLESSWARTFFGTLTQLIRTRIEQCLEEDVRRKLVKFEAILNL